MLNISGTHAATWVNFINIFGEKRMAKSAKSPVNCKKLELCVQKLELCAKNSFFDIRVKKLGINMLMKLTPGSRNWQLISPHRLHPVS